MGINKDIAFLKTLAEKEQFLLELVVVQAENIDGDTIYQFADRLKKRYSLKEIRSFLLRLFDKKIITSSHYWQTSYNISDSFLVWFFPKIREVKKIYKLLQETSPSYHYYQSNHQKQLRNLLYALLFESTDTYRTLEKQFSEYYSEPLKDILGEIVENDDYLPYLNKIQPYRLEYLVYEKMSVNIFTLTPFSDTKRYFSLVEPYLKGTETKARIMLNEYLSSGEIDKALEIQIPDEDDPLPFFLRAIKLLLEDQTEDSVRLFEKGLKVQRRILKGTYLPTDIKITLYYLIALLRLDSKISTPVFQRILKALNEVYHSAYDLFKPLVMHILGTDNNRKYNQNRIEELLRQNNIASLIALPVYYLCDYKALYPSFFEHSSKLIKNAYQNGFPAIALEAAFALDQIFLRGRSEELYREIRSKGDHIPLLSKITRTEEWEKSINMLLGSQPQSVGKEATARVAYFFNPKHNFIQPVSQTKQLKGWSKGRNIALKTFFEGKTPGMTEQDARIAKSMGHSSYHYPEYYFKESIFRELIGHPHLFLEGINEIPIEFCAGKVQIYVENNENSFVLKSNIETKAFEKKIYIKKETNTRYNIYDFTQKQIDILKIINEKQITVPEAGKDKLIQLLSVLSMQGMEVHSDLFASEDSDVSVTAVAADSKIRVQLLPFGEGLKAELFCKPFGGHPPYCKPAKGGKVLLRNGEKGIQYQVKRDMDQEKRNETSLMNDIQSLESLEMQDGLITFNDPMDSLYLLELLKKHNDICIIEWPEGERFRVSGTASFGNLKLSLKTKTNWFDLQGELAVDEKTVLTLQQLLALTEKGHGRFVELSTGEFLALSEGLKKRLDDLRMFASGDKQGISVNKFASVALDGLFDQVEQLKTDKAWKEFRKRVEETKNVETTVPSSLMTELRTYQEEGFKWMIRLSQWNAGACLADDMGLGKTIQALAVLLHRAELGSALVVCPVSVVGNWINEVNRFAPTLNVKTLSNTNRQQVLDELQAGDLLITSYGLLQSEEELFRKYEFSTIILDEAHTIKNFATKTSKATMQLQGDFRIALTGTPIQNHLGEIWNLFNFINPGLLGNMNQFTDRFIKPDDDAAKKRLKKLISPFILRRTKTTVLDELPPKTEIIKKVSLSENEMAFYEALRRQALENISGNEESNGAKHLQVLAEITRLRQACCNPKLVDRTIDIPSSKLATFLDIVNELNENNHRALVFSQFVTHLAIVREALDKMKVSYQYLDGSTPGPEREKRVKAFQSGKGKLFLISLKAGGLGLNLTAADYVIHLDPWWNPAVEDQASDRAHRIGQKRPVTIYRLVAENTIEEKIVRLHDTKRDLAESLLEGSDRSARLSLAELMELIGSR